MEKVIWVLIFLFLVGGVFADKAWGDINTGDKTSNLNNGTLVDSQKNDSVPISSNEGTFVNSGDGKFYTLDFYIGMILILILILIVVFFIWSWIQGPKNKWERGSGFIKIKRKVDKK